MAEHKRNHFVPRFMLHYWSSRPPGRNYTGVWVYELASKKKYFANGQGASAYSFAVSEDLYVPMVGGERVTAQERWHGSLEGRLAAVAKQVHERVDPLRVQPEDLFKLPMALFALEARSPHNIRKLEEALKAKPELLSRLATRPGVALHHLVLENLVNYVDELARRHSPPAVEFVFSDSGSVLLSDRPYFNNRELPHRFFALTSRVCVALRVGGGPWPFTYRYLDAHPDFLRVMNHQFALAAREWIAAKDEALLDRHIEVVSSDEWQEAIRSEKVEAEALTHLTNGWVIGRTGVKGR